LFGVSKEMSVPKIPLAIIALIMIAIALTATTYGAISINKNISTNGSIITSPNIGIYSDSSCTTNLSSIDWGPITPGTNVTKTVYVKNTGVGTSLTLAMSTSNWNPTSANGPITVTWDKQNLRLSPGQSATAVITLVASSAITDVDNFSVQILISATP
jgi:hypothetical protein